jgi:phospholipid/cholesterol/gamma-HCH transport system substrate-binding protein
MNEATPQAHDRRALWFTLVPIAALALLLAAIAFKQQMFAASDQLLTFTDSGYGIATGMPVKIQGFGVGSVRNVDLVPPEDGSPPKVRLTLAVSRDAMHYISKDSTVRFVQEGLIGQAILEIAHGKDRARRAAHGDVLAFERGRTLSELAGDLSSKAQPVLDNVQSFTRQLSDPNGDFALTLKGARQVMARTDETMAALGTKASATLNTTSSLLQRAEQTLPKVDGVLDTADNLLHHAEKTLPKVDTVLDQAQEIALSAKTMVGKTQSLVDDGSQVVEDASKTAKTAMRSWPFSTWAPKAPAQTVPLDSQESAPSFLEPTSAKAAP